MNEDSGRVPGAVPARLVTLRADNPGPLTLTGTNTYVVLDAGQAWIVDPGPRDPEHLARILESSQIAHGVRPAGILVTHRHGDHTDAAGTLRRQLENRTGRSVPLWAADPAAVPGARDVPSELVGDHGTVAHVIHLPGHTDDSIGLLVDGGRMLTGDTLLGGASTVIVPRDGGDLTAYLQSLAVPRALALDGRISSLHPGHGPAATSPTEAIGAIEQAIAHREERIRQVREARAAGALTMPRLPRAVYGPDLPDALREAAEWNLRATVEHLARIA